MVYILILIDPEKGNATKEKTKFGTANFLIEIENKRAIKVVILTQNHS